MAFIKLDTFSEAIPNFRAQIDRLNRLLSVLAKRELPEHMVTFINTELANINELKGKDKADCRIVSKHQQQILKQLEKDLKLVSKGHYQKQWMILGLSAFGIPLGVVFSFALGNMGLLGLGLPIGMALGIAVGTAIDQKAAKEGRQINFK